MQNELPITRHIPRIKSLLGKERTLIIEAPPGAGKTTRVPIALLDEPWLAEKKILLLEPRRLAAISCASHMSNLRSEPVGRTIGYQIRFDRKSGPDTRLLVVTEGIFTRMIQGDPELKGIGLVIFDEFHERSITSDLGLALARETQEVLNLDLRIVVMSATMETERLSAMLSNAPIVRSQGRTFPVKTVYLPGEAKAGRHVPVEKKTFLAIGKALDRTKGDILVFLPGVAEIKRLEHMLAEKLATEVYQSLIVLPLYGNLTGKDQAKAFKKTPEGKTKLILATSIAETSITIDGIKVVIDSGMMRKPRFSSRTGMTLLETVRVSRASADQRRGRAGRTAEGTCFRLWSEYEQSALQPFSRPEVLSADLSGLVLELAAWGISDAKDLSWLDLPPDTAVENARELLVMLGALDRSGRITSHGKKMVRSGLHPRLSHMVIKAQKKGFGYTGVRLSAMLMEKDILLHDPMAYEPDVHDRLDMLSQYEKGVAFSGGYLKADKKRIRRVLESEKKIAKDMGIKDRHIDTETAGSLLAFAYPDRICKKRSSGQKTYLSAGGKGVCFKEETPLSKHEYIVAVHLDGNPRNAKVFLGAPYSRHELERDFSELITKETALLWDDTAKEVKQKNESRFFRLVLESRDMNIDDPQGAVNILLEEIRKTGLDILPWSDALTGFLERVNFLKSTGHFDSLPDVSGSGLINTLETWLEPFLSGITSFDSLKTLDMNAVCQTLVPWDKKQTVEKHAPTHLIVPSGSKKKLEYSDQTGILNSPVLKVRLQEMFGLTRTLKVAANTVPVTIHLLSPAGRAVQITQDLESFWKNTYPEVKKDFKGRYPKHYWPDDPYTATATNRVRPKKS